MNNPKSEILLEIKNMKKNFGSTIALKGVDLRVNRGEIRGLVGENGSGKSTVTSIVAGMQKATEGEMYFLGQPWSPETMVEAQSKGISMILQEANTIPGVTVAQNIFAGQEERFAKAGFVNMKKMYREADEVLKSFGLDNVKGSDYIDRYGFEDRKLIEIVRAVTDDTQLLVVDETTTALSLEGRQILYRLIHRMADENKAVIFISHDMDEILEQCTVITVLRDGEITGEFGEDDLKDLDNPGVRKNTERAIRLPMVGREIGDKYYREDYDSSCSKEAALVLDNITFGSIKDFSLTLHKGEIVGFGGLSGCGMHEIGRAAFGLEKLERGRVLRDGKEIKSCLSAVRNGIGYISKNRDREALILQGSIAENIVFPSIKDMQKHFFISPKKEKAKAQKEIDTYRIKCGSPTQWVNTLSGGNKQKVSFAKWTAKDSDVIIMDCPTRGVDIGVKQAMYQMIYDMKKAGKAIIMISEELSELIGMTDRLYIMKDFEVKKEFKRSADLKETDIIEYMI